MASASQDPRSRSMPGPQACNTFSASLTAANIGCPTQRSARARPQGRRRSRRHAQDRTRPIAAARLFGDSSVSAGSVARRRQARTKRRPGPTSSPGRVSSTASRNAASSSTRPACFGRRAAARQAPGAAARRRPISRRGAPPHRARRPPRRRRSHDPQAAVPSPLLVKALRMRRLAQPAGTVVDGASAGRRPAAVRVAGERFRARNHGEQHELTAALLATIFAPNRRACRANKTNDNVALSFVLCSTAEMAIFSRPKARKTRSTRALRIVRTARRPHDDVSTARLSAEPSAAAATARPICPTSSTSCWRWAGARDEVAGVRRTPPPRPRSAAAGGPADRLPAHLEQLADRARDYVEAASSANTRRAYAADWKHFSRLVPAPGSRAAAARIRRSSASTSPPAPPARRPATASRTRWRRSSAGSRR